MRAAIVCGPRDGTGLDIVFSAMDLARCSLAMPRFDYLVVGSARGTDYQAFEWAMAREIWCMVCPARWNTGKYTGAPEGPERNLLMYSVLKPVVVFGFSGGPGTSGMMSISCYGGTPTYWWSPIDSLWLLDERMNACPS